ncbi:MAG: GAF domain-containing protein, partial [Anaerolineae bacterium]|nr:GAF domain-containing protein [Anaerolineae bacterium]
IYLIQDGLLRYVNPAGARMFGYEPEELIDRLSPLDVVAPEDRERVTENIRRRLTDEVLSIRYTIQGLRKDGSRFPCEVLGTRVEYRGRPAILGTLVDLTDRVRAEEAVRRRAAQTEALRQIALELFSQPDLEVLLPSIVQRAVELVGGSAGGIYLYRPEEDALEWVVSIGPNQPPIGTRLRPSEGGISRKVWETGRSFWVDDYQTWEGRAGLYAGYPWTAVIGVPVRRGEEMLGALIVLADPPRTFSQEDADLLDLFAAQAAVALTNARLYETIQQEREQLDFLHSLGQRLAGTLDVGAIAREALETLCRMTGGQQGVVYVTESGTSRLHLVAAVGHEGATVEELDRRLQFRVGQGLAGWVALHRRTAVVDDVTQDDRWVVAQGMDEHVRSAASVPLLFGEELVGVMSLGSLETAAFTTDHVRLLEAAGAVIASALLNARLYQTEQERARRMAAVAELGERLAAILEPEAVYREVVEGIVHAFGYDYVGLMLLDETARELEFIAGAGIWAGRTPPGFRQKVGEGMMGWVAQYGETLQANDVSREPRYIAPYLTETRAELDVPLKYHGRLVGVLTIQSRHRDAFTPLDVAVVETLAGYIAAAITNAQLYQAQQRRANELAVLHRAAVTVSSQQTLDSMLEALAQQMGQALDITSVYISLWDEKTGTSTQLKGWFGPQASEKERAATLADVGQTFDLGPHPKVVAALRERRPQVFQASGSLDPGNRAEAERYGWKSQLVVPLVARDRAIGFVSLCESRREREFAEAEIRFCQTLAADAAAAIENARLYEQERAARQRQEALFRIGQIVNSTLDPDVILDRLTEEAMRATGATHGSVLVPDPERGVFERRSLRGYSPQERERALAQPLSLTQGINSRAYQTRLTYYVPDVRQDPNYFPLISTTRSELVIPLLRGDRVLGNLDLQSPRVDAFRNVDMEFLRALADQVAIALENARLYEAERRRAQEQEILTLIATALNTLEVQRAFPILVHGLRTLTGCDRISVALLEEGGTQYRIAVLETPFPVLGVGTIQPLSTTPV